jgi:hypothetical protein
MGNIGNTELRCIHDLNTAPEIFVGDRQTRFGLVVSIVISFSAGASDSRLLLLKVRFSVAAAVQRKTTGTKSVRKRRRRQTSLFNNMVDKCNIDKQTV